MREIKFRGKNRRTGEWKYGFFVKAYEHLIHEGDIGDIFVVEPNTVGQFTGLLDKNGKEIYEGDYLLCRQWIGGNFVEHCCEQGYVDFVFGSFGLHRKQGFYRPFKDWLENYELEIIGNIYENPELLKEATL